MYEQDVEFWKSEGNWYKGNLHTHTTNSDGDLSPIEIIKNYKSNGYDFLALTDHDKLTAVGDLLPDQEDILVIPGEEITFSKYHILGINLNKSIDPAKVVNAQDVIDKIVSQGGIAIIAHPYWSGLNINDLKSINNYLGIEIFNTSCHYSIGKGFSLSHWEDLLLAGYRSYGFFNDDSHWHFNDHRPNDTCGSWIMVKAQELTTENIIGAIKTGNFYASNGPSIENIEVSNGNIYVKCSPVRIINFIGPTSSGESFTAIRSKTISEAEHKLKSSENYIRIECIDHEGHYAISNPVFF